MPTPLLEPGVPFYFFNAENVVAPATSIMVATPATQAQFSWVVSFSSAPSATSVTLQGSMDGLSWFSLDNASSTAGEIRNTVVAVPFLRIVVNTKTGGGTLTVGIVAKNYILRVIGADAFATNDIVSTGIVDLANHVPVVGSAGRSKLYSALNPAGNKTRLVEIMPTGVALPVVVGGTLFWENSNLGNGANTDYVAATPYTVPAGLMVNDGDELLIEMWMTFNAAVSTKTYLINIGYTSWSAAGGVVGGNNLVNSATAGASASQFVTAIIRRISASGGGYMGTSRWSGAATVQGGPYTTGSVIWANPQNIIASVKDSVGNVDAVKINQLKISYLPNHS